MLSAAIIDMPDWGFVSEMAPGGHIAAILSPYDALWGRQHLELRDTLWLVMPNFRGQLVFLFRKPLDQTITKNVVGHRAGALNIDATRVEHADPADFKKHKAMVDRLKVEGGSLGNSWKNTSDLSGASEVSELGRWPSNVLIVHTPECRRASAVQVGGSKDSLEPPKARSWKSTSKTGFQRVGYADDDGKETLQLWECAPNCSAVMLDILSGNRPGMSGGGEHRANYKGGLFGTIDCAHTARGDSGGASRFFPQLQGHGELVDWLTRLLVPPGGKFLVRISNG